MTHISLFTDAAFRDKLKLATYGAYFVKDRKRYEGGGIINGTVRTSVDAESMAIIKGLECIHSNSELKTGDKVLIQTDCTGAIIRFEKAKHIVWAWDSIRRQALWDRRSNYYEVGIDNIFWMYVYKHDVQIEFRHVNGHTRGRRPNEWVNNKCDSIAAKWMEEALQLRSAHKITA